MMKATKKAAAFLFVLTAIVLLLSACTVKQDNNPPDDLKTDGPAVVNPTTEPADDPTSVPTDAPASAPTEIPVTATPEITPEPHVHQFTSDWNHDETSHWQLCECGESGEKTAHTFGEETVLTAAACTEDGSSKSVCTVCGFEELHVIEKTGHTVVKDEAVDATCTEAGKTEGSHCSVCGQVITAQETIPAKGHTPKTVPGKEPTTTSEGLTEGEVCSVCGAVLVKQEVIPKLKNYTAPSQEQIDEFADVAVRTLQLFGRTGDPASVSLETMMRYYFFYLNRDGWYEFDSWEKRLAPWMDEDEEDPLLVYTISESELKEWFRLHLGAEPDFKGMKGLPVDDMECYGPAAEAGHKYIFEAEYIESEKVITITQYHWIGWGGGGPEPFRPFYKYKEMKKDGNDYVFIVTEVTKEKPSDMTGVETDRIYEVKSYYDDEYYEEWWGFESELSDGERQEYQAEDYELTFATVYYVPVRLITEHVDGEFCLKAIK